jgi:hypothetical protein
VPALKKRRTLVLLLIAVLVFVLLACSCMCGASYLAYDRLWNTPERALKALADAVAHADIPEARRYVSDELWPADQLMPDPSMVRALEHFEGVQNIVWTDLTPSTASSTWTEIASVPELAVDANVQMKNIDGHWKLAGFAAGWGEDVSGVSDLLKTMRDEADARDGVGFLNQVVPGDRTCRDRACRSIAESVTAGTATGMVDDIKMTEVEPGTLRVTRDGDGVTVRWLRKTRYLDQEGLTELHFKEVDGKWVVVTADGSNFRKLDEAMETWTENHGEMLWRAQVADYVQVRSLPAFCGEYYYGVCLTEILPSEISNIGQQDIKQVKVSKVRALRYMGNASQTLWGIWRNLKPGQKSSDPSSASAPVHTGTTSGTTWEFYRVEWIEFADGTRLSYAARDYREAAGGTLTFSEVRTAREHGDMSVEAYDKLIQERVAAGYPPEAPPPQNAPAPDAPTP